LVKEHQLDIATVPLASVAQQYFDYVAAMQALDVELAAEYLVIAATLVFSEVEVAPARAPGRVSGRRRGNARGG
jgi:segregation and condensation protein A